MHDGVQATVDLFCGGTQTFSEPWTSGQMSQLRRSVQLLRDARRAAGDFALLGISPFGQIQNLICAIHYKYDLGEFDLFPEEDPQREFHLFEMKSDGFETTDVDLDYIARRCETVGNVKFPNETLFAVARLNVGYALSVSDACRRYRIRRIK